jgi:hypothetical protein
MLVKMFTEGGKWRLKKKIVFCIDTLYIEDYRFGTAERKILFPPRKACEQQKSASQEHLIKTALHADLMMTADVLCPVLYVHCDAEDGEEGT